MNEGEVFCGAAPPSGVDSTEQGRTVATAVIDQLRVANQTVATAESFTGGLVSGLLTAVPGASACVQEGVVAYAATAKREELGVRQELLDERGTVDADVVTEMARGVRDRAGTTWGVATTGVAGPDPADGGDPVGTAYVGVASGPTSGDSPAAAARLHRLDGDRETIKVRGATAALEDLLAVVETGIDDLE